MNRRGEDVAAAGIVADACGHAQPVVQFIRIALRKFGNRVDSKHAEVFARRRPDVRELEEFVFGFRSGHQGRGGAGGLFCPKVGAEESRKVGAEESKKVGRARSAIVANYVSKGQRV